MRSWGEALRGTGAQQKYWVKDFGLVFERYIKA
ncbi:YvbH-like oligomerization domain-containing protein [Archangium gephyra]